VAPCRAYWTCVGLLVAFNAMVWLTIANEVLRRAEGPQGRSREIGPGDWCEKRYLIQVPGDVDTTTTTTGGPPDIYDFQHLAPNGGTTAYISERN